MSQIENHWDEVAQIETQLMRKMIALGLDWKDPTTMRQLASECKVFGPADVESAYSSKDQGRITRAEIFSLASLMMQTMENATLESREVHGGEVWKAFARHLYT